MTATPGHRPGAPQRRPPHVSIFFLRFTGLRGRNDSAHSLSHDSLLCGAYHLEIDRHVHQGIFEATNDCHRLYFSIPSVRAIYGLLRGRRLRSKSPGSSSGLPEVCEQRVILFAPARRGPLSRLAASGVRHVTLPPTIR